MTDEDKKLPPVRSIPEQRRPGEPILPYVTRRPKRRKSGPQHDDGWPDWPKDKRE